MTVPTNCCANCLARTLNCIILGNDRRRPSCTAHILLHIATMRFSSTLVLALPALTLAEEQVPLVDKLKGFWNKATAVASSAIPAAPSPLDAGAAKAAEHIQHELTVDNWKDVLTVDPTTSAPTTQDWLVFITGGNVTCFGFCGNATKAWNVGSTSSTPPHISICGCSL